MTFTHGGTLFEEHTHPDQAHRHDLGEVAFPQGFISLWYGAAAAVPAGWAICDGTNGTPDMRGRVAVGVDTAQVEFDTLGEAGGAKTHTLTEAQMPVHGHGSTGVPTSQPSQDRFGDWTAGGAQAGWATVGVTGGSSNFNAHTHAVGNAGSGSSHPILQPYRALHYIMKK